MDPRVLCNLDWACVMIPRKVRYSVGCNHEHDFGVTLQLGMYQVYDVTHNTAKEEEHQVNGQKKRLLVHRKGATRAYPPGHPSLPERWNNYFSKT